MSSIALSRKALATIGALALTFGAFSLNVAAAHAEDVSDQNTNTTVSDQNGNADVSDQDGNADVSGQDGNGDSSGQDGNGDSSDGLEADAVTLSAYTVVPGQTITVSTAAGLFAAGESVDIELHSDVKVLKSGAVANENGVINEQVTIPLDAELGTHHIVVGDLTSADLKIVAADASSNDTGSLAKTGLESSALLAGALLITAAGAATVAAARRRSAQH